jgi:hypothetical protein
VASKELIMAPKAAAFGEPTTVPPLLEALPSGLSLVFWGAGAAGTAALTLSGNVIL